jgi:hypothetical protein
MSFVAIIGAEDLILQEIASSLLVSSIQPSLGNSNENVGINYNGFTFFVKDDFHVLEAWYSNGTNFKMNPAAAS